MHSSSPFLFCISFLFPEKVSWYRKYRPQIFADLVGQDHIRSILLSSLRKEKPSHAYLFSGPRGTGKTSTARILGKALNCLRLRSDGEPCSECSNCREIQEGLFVDIIEIDAASNTGVDHIRDLRDKIGYSPTIGKAKVYIIDEVHMLSSGAFNALLKTLEEPPGFVYFILATTEIHKVPETIQSRCQQFSFRRITADDIIMRLRQIGEREHIVSDEESFHILATQSGGGLRDAISLFEQYSSGGELNAELLRTQMGIVPETFKITFYEALNNGETVEALALLDRLSVEGFSLSEFIRGFILHIRDKMISAVERGDSTDNLLLLIEIFDEAQRKIKFAVIPQLPIEVAVVKATEVIGKANPKSVASKGGIFSIFSGGEKKSSEETLAEKKKKEEKKGKEKADEEITSPKNDEMVATKKNAEFLAPELSVGSVRERWPQIVETISNSSLRMSLKNAGIVSLEKDILTIDVPDAFWKEKIEKTSNLNEFISAFEQIFSRKIQLVCRLKEVILEPAVAESHTPGKNQEDKGTLVDAFQEIMGAPVRKKDDL